MFAEKAGISKIIITCGKTDLRKGIDGLAQLIGTNKLYISLSYMSHIQHLIHRQNDENEYQHRMQYLNVRLG